MRTRARPPCGVTETTGPGTALTAPSGGSERPSTSQGWTATATRPSNAPVERISVPWSSSTTLPAPSRRATPGSRFAPVNAATKASAGCAMSSAGVPSWRRRPCTITPTRAASAAASSNEWLTSSAGRSSDASSSCSSPRTTCRVCESSADSGSSSSSTCGSRASARARATRWRSPPDRLSGRASARWAMRKRSSSSPTRSRPPNATFARTLMCGNRAYSWNTRPTERSSGGRSTPRARSNHARSPSAIRPSSGATRPATARSTVVLPAPEGPASAIVSRSTVSSASRRKCRSCFAIAIWRASTRSASWSRAGSRR